MKTFSEFVSMYENNGADISAIASGMDFLPTSKKKLTYNFVDSDEDMPPLTYTIAKESKPIVTVTADGKETQNTAMPNDIIISGIGGEKYVIKAAKFGKLYTGTIGGSVIVDQTPRMVAQYNGDEIVMFKAPWGEDMVLKPGDYLVKQEDGQYYRIAKLEYESTYNPPGKVG